uniref:ATP-dependent DNA helicase n=1 Tax=Glossina palpalis gambiensis TaxID=67801 RepID=A0A1B0AP30_9MUSC
MGDKNNDLIFFITGNDGDMLRNHITRLVAKQAVKVVYGLMGFAAGLVSNSTLHSTLKLRVQNVILSKTTISGMLSNARQSDWSWRVKDVYSLSSVRRVTHRAYKCIFI